MAASDPADLARHALEQVCSGSDASAAVGVYSPEFHDHVNAASTTDTTGSGSRWVSTSSSSVTATCAFRVEDQVSEGERVASRWVAEGHNRGSAIRIWGIVISRIEDGEIVEDWAASDNLDLIRQLGPWRTLRLGIAWLPMRLARLTACRASPTDPTPR